jgi:hypothetical protein
VSDASIPSTEGGPDLKAVRETIDQHFPGLWPAVDVALSVCATLLLAQNTNPTALIFVGGPSSSKTTVSDMFADAAVTVTDDDPATHDLFYLSDSFTPAAFVSQAASRSAKDLEKVDLLPRIKHKVLVTPELAPVFRGKDDELVKTFKIITRVLDGHGLKTDSATHGARGYRGDYLFCWIGATTPFDNNVWQMMGQLGSRLFFFVMGDDGEEVTVEMLVQSEEQGDYSERLAACKTVVADFLRDLFKRYGGIRSVHWDAEKDPRDVKEGIARLAKLLATMRSEPTREASPEHDHHGYVPAKREKPWRANAVLRNLARGHALVHGRTELAQDDLPPIAAVTVASMPPALGRVFTALVEKIGWSLNVAECTAALDVQHPETARKVMEELDRRGVASYEHLGPGLPWTLTFHPRWSWCGTEEFAALLRGTPVKNPGLCVEGVSAGVSGGVGEGVGEGVSEGVGEAVREGVSEDVREGVTNNLVERQTEREDERSINSPQTHTPTYTPTHTPEKMTGPEEPTDPQEMTAPQELLGLREGI